LKPSEAGVPESIPEFSKHQKLGESEATKLELQNHHDP
jgi:hypothetical protein